MAGSRHNGNGHKSLHVTETPDVSHIKNLDVTHEVSDVDVSGILKFVLGLTVLTVAVFVLMWGLFRFFYAETEKEPNPGPMAMTEQERLPPQPRLQAARGFGVTLENGQTVNLEMKEPAAEFRVVREQWERQLKCPAESEAHRNGEAREMGGKVETKIIPTCLPIDQAMQKVVEAGLPSRKEDGASSDPGLKLPTAASSGRIP
jgi:hypothetical protein